MFSCLKKQAFCFYFILRLLRMEVTSPERTKFLAMIREKRSQKRVERNKSEMPTT